MFCILSGSTSFTDPPDSVLINSMDLWDPYYLKYIFEDDTEQENVNVFNSSISDMELLNSIEKMEWGELYAPIVEDIFMDDDQLLQVVNEIEQG